MGGDGRGSGHAYHKGPHKGVEVRGEKTQKLVKNMVLHYMAAGRSGISAKRSQEVH